MTTIKIKYRGDLATECVHESGAIIETDAPKDNQGRGLAFSPTDLLAASLGSCMLTLMGIAANRLKVDLKGTSAEVTKEMSKDPPRRIARIIVRIRSSYRPAKDVQRMLEEAALECPVHHSLHPDIRKEIDFIWGL